MFQNMKLSPAKVIFKIASQSSRCAGLKLNAYLKQLENTVRLLIIVSMLSLVLGGCKVSPGDAHGFTGRKDISFEIGLKGGKQIKVSTSGNIDLGLKLGGGESSTARLTFKNTSEKEIKIENLNIQLDGGGVVTVTGLAPGQLFKPEEQVEFTVEAPKDISEQKGDIDFVVASGDGEGDKLAVACAVSAEAYSVRCGQQDEPIRILVGKTYEGIFPKVDSTQDSGMLTYSIDTQPEAGSVLVTNAATGAYTFTPPVEIEQFSARFYFKVTTEDGFECTSPMSIDGLVPPPPQLQQSSAYSIPVVSPTASVAIYLQAPRLHPDFKDLKYGYRMVAAPQHGTVGRFGPRSVNFTPELDYVGADQLVIEVYYLDLPTIASQPTTINLEIYRPTALGQLSVPVMSNHTPQPGAPTSILLTGTNNYGDNAQVYFHAGQAPSFGTLTLVRFQDQPGVNTAGTNVWKYMVTYTPWNGYSGPDQFSYGINLRDRANAYSNGGVVNILPTIPEAPRK